MSIGSAVGYCTIHKIDKMMVGSSDENLEPVCVKCRAAAEPKTGRPQTEQDPGEAFFSGKRSIAETTTPHAPHGDIAILRPSYTSSLTLAQIVDRAVSELNNLPMPKDIKQFKQVQKVIKTLQSLVENTNG